MCTPNKSSLKFALAGTLTSPNIVQACTTYSTSLTSPAGPSILNLVNTSTGQATAIGPLGPPQTNATNAISIQPSTRTLYGVSTPTFFSEFLFTIDKSTGQASTPIPVTADIPPVPAIINDISFRSDGTLFVLGSFGNRVVLYTMNLSTGQLTTIGIIVAGPNVGDALGFDGANNLYAVITNPTTGINTVYLVNQSTGTGTPVSTVVFSGFPSSIRPRINGIVWSPCLNTFLVNVVSGPIGSGSPIADYLATLDPLSGVARFIGPTNLRTNALAVDVVRVQTMGSLRGVRPCRSKFVIQSPFVLG